MVLARKVDISGTDLPDTATDDIAHIHANTDKLSPLLVYKGTDRKTMAGAAQEIAIAANSKIAMLSAEGGAIRYAVNADATNASGGYLSTGCIVVVFLSGATKLSVYGEAASYANVMFYG